MSDPSHNPIDTDLAQAQSRSMPKKNLVDICVRAGVKTCQDSNCILFRAGCPLVNRKNADVGKSTERSKPQ
jgi:hypothetical protein